MRINGAISDILKAWFQKLEVSDIKAIKPENRWNMDKAGIIEGQRENRLMIRSTQKHFIQKKQPGFKACISATSKALLPLVIFKGKSV